MKTLLQLLFLAFVLSGCNNLNDLRPADPGTEIPETAVKVVKTKFPNAEELVFKPVLADKIWEVKLKSDQDRYSSLVDYGKMWETFKVSPDGVPATLDQIMAKTAFGGGTFSNYTTAYFAATASHKLIYNYRGENYSFEWSGLMQNVNGTASFDPSVYRITTFELNDLPAFVKDTIQAMPSTAFTAGYTWVRLDDSKLYYVIASQKVADRLERISMLFDDKGRLRWASTGFQQPGVPNIASNLNEVPAQISQYIDSLPELAGYEYDRKIVNQLNGLTSYYVTLRIGSVSRCELYFDQDFNVINKKYAVILY